MDFQIETSKRISRLYPDHWVVTAFWYDGRVPVFESDPDHPAFIQLADCFNYVKTMGA